MWVCSGLSDVLFTALRQGLSLNQKLTLLAQLTSWPAPGIYPSTPCNNGMTGMHSHA